jgi:hypothetical protein
MLRLVCDHKRMPDDDLRPKVTAFLEGRGLAHATWREKADALDVDTSVLHSWFKNPNRDITLATANKMLRAMNPSGQAEPDPHAGLRVQEGTTAHYWGYISAGEGTISADASPLPDDFNLEDIVQKVSPAKRRATKGPLSLVSIQGTSMEPEYPEGAMLLVAPVLDATRVPDGWDCVFRSGSEFTLKRLRRQVDKAGKITHIIGVPLNTRTHSPIIWKPSQVVIHSIALAVIGAP